jgi:hypothetical protein
MTLSAARILEKISFMKTSRNMEFVLVEMDGEPKAHSISRRKMRIRHGWSTGEWQPFIVYRPKKDGLAITAICLTLNDGTIFKNEKAVTMSASSLCAF